ncbi:CASP-like protein 4B1 [Andrographis paniculata]|uniref:CASP-like protein 4B1 n=1 Tax=Andrographis paniculata TaxID=175694 RepID=UPI0021E90788|nr:CASP-like protein 4B1 [Andrographis paniculata]
MENPADSKPDKSNPQPPPPDLETGGPAPPAVRGAGDGDGDGGVASIVERWKREDVLKKTSLASRGLGFVFSLLSFIVMATNKHGDWREFDNYEEYRYLVGIAILSTLYTGFQVFRQYRELSKNRPLFSWKHLPMADFLSDQIVAYLLISSASSAVPLTDRMREGADSIFTDASSAAIAMQFFAFFAMAISAVVSGHKLNKQSYV